MPSCAGCHRTPGGRPLGRAAFAAAQLKKPAQLRKCRVCVEIATLSTASNSAPDPRVDLVVLGKAKKTRLMLLERELQRAKQMDGIVVMIRSVGPDGELAVDGGQHAIFPPIFPVAAAPHAPIFDIFKHEASPPDYGELAFGDFALPEVGVGGDWLMRGRSLSDYNIEDGSTLTWRLPTDAPEAGRLDPSIFVATPAGEMIRVRGFGSRVGFGGKPNQTIADFKDAISKITRIPRHQQTLAFVGVVLDDDNVDFPGSHAIRDGSVLTLSPNLAPNSEPAATSMLSQFVADRLSASEEKLAIPSYLTQTPWNTANMKAPFTSVFASTSKLTTALGHMDSAASAPWASPVELDEDGTYVFVQTCGSHSMPYPLRVDPADSVAQIKAAVEKRGGMQSDLQLVTVGSRAGLLLEGGRPLSDYSAALYFNPWVVVQQRVTNGANEGRPTMGTLTVRDTGAVHELHPGDNQVGKLVPSRWIQIGIPNSSVANPVSEMHATIRVVMEGNQYDSDQMPEITVTDEHSRAGTSWTTKTPLGSTLSTLSMLMKPGVPTKVKSGMEVHFGGTAVVLKIDERYLQGEHWFDPEDMPWDHEDLNAYHVPVSVDLTAITPSEDSDDGLDHPLDQGPKSPNSLEHGQRRRKRRKKKKKKKKTSDVESTGNATDAVDRTPSVAAREKKKNVDSIADT